MDLVKPFADDRLVANCIHCAGDTETRDHCPSRMLLDKPYPEKGVYAQTAENSVTLTYHLEYPGADDVVLFMADPAVSENTCLATGWKGASFPPLHRTKICTENPAAMVDRP